MNYLSISTHYKCYKFIFQIRLIHLFYLKLLSQFICIIYIAVSNIEAIQSQLKNIYTNTLSTLCPLPWLEEAGDVQYNFDDVFIPLRTIDIAIQQKDGDLSGPSGSRNDEEQTADFSGPSGETGLHHQTRYTYDNVRLLYNILYFLYAINHGSYASKQVE